MKLAYEQFKKYIEDNGVTDARTTEDWGYIPKGTLIKFGLKPDGTITSWESFLEGQKQYEYIFCAQWIAAWTVYKGLFEVEDQKELRISVKTQEEWNAVVKKMLDDGYNWANGLNDLFSNHWAVHKKDSEIYSTRDDGYKISFADREYTDEYLPHISLQSAQEYLGYDPNNSQEEVKVKYANFNLRYTSETDWDAVKKQLEVYEKNPSSDIQVDYVKSYTWFRFPNGTTEAYKGKLSKEEIKRVIDDKQSKNNPFNYNDGFTPEQVNRIWTGDVEDEHIKSKLYISFNKLTKPKGNKYMSIISNAFKSKENKALEYFNLGTTDNLSERGRQEFIDFLFETLKEEKKAFLSKMVEAYKEDKE